MTHPSASTTVGGYLAPRLYEAGAGHFFTVPGDFNLVLLDRLLEEPRLEMIGGCNELNAGYAAALANRLGSTIAEALGADVAVMPDAKGLFPEDHPLFLGTYWGSVSSPGCAEVVESSDCQIFAGAVFTDYSTVGRTGHLPKNKRVFLGEDFVETPAELITGTCLASVLQSLAEKVPGKPASSDAFRRAHEDTAPPTPAPPEAPLSLRELPRQIQELPPTAASLVIETGDRWFNGQKLKLHSGLRYHFQMQHGSIGWATGATLGVAFGSPGRGITLTGDGSFQLTAQEASTMTRPNLRPIIFLINNQGYTIEVEIHDGPYNHIQNWDYAGLIQVFSAGGGRGLDLQAGTAGELSAAVARAQDPDGPVLIECQIGRDDCSQKRLEWGSRVAATNGRPPD